MPSPRSSGPAPTRPRPGSSAAKLTLGSTTQAFSETVAAGLVISVSPKEGTSLKRGAQVDLVVSKGREPIQVTDFTGKSADDAVKALTGAGLQVDATQQKNDDKIPKGSVISQDPSSGTLFKGEQGHPRRLQGPELVKVPDVQGKQEAEAVQQLKAAGFDVKVRAVHGRASSAPSAARTPRAAACSRAGRQRQPTVVTLVVV